jgi:hypothetical protein
MPGRRNLVVWSSSAVPAQRRRTGRRGRRIRWWLRTGALLAVIGVLRLARTARTRWEPVSLLAGAVLTVAGLMMSTAAAFFAGLLVLIATLLKGIASQTARSPRF